MSPRATAPKSASTEADEAAVTPKQAKAPAPTQADLPYEQAREELVEVVRRLESGGVPLAESLALWERGRELADMCQRWLDGARARIEAAEPARSE